MAESLPLLATFIPTVGKLRAPALYHPAVGRLECLLPMGTWGWGQLGAAPGQHGGAGPGSP